MNVELTGEEQVNHYMMKHLTQNRISDKFRGFSYRKILKDSSTTRGRIYKVIAWDETLACPNKKKLAKGLNHPVAPA